MAVRNAGDLLFGPMIQALGGLKKQRERESVREEQRRRYDEEKTYQKQQDLKRDRDRLEQQRRGLSAEMLESGAGNYITARIHGINERLGESEIPTVAAPAPAPSFAPPVTPESVDPEAFGGVLGAFMKDKQAQATPATPFEPSRELMGARAVAGMPVPEPQPDPMLQRKLAIARAEGYPTVTPAELGELESREQREATALDMLHRAQLGASQELGAERQRIEEAERQRQKPGEQIVREAIEARLPARQGIATEEAARRTEEARKAEVDRLRKMRGLREEEGIEPVETRHAYRDLRALKEGRSAEKRQKEFNAARDTLVKGLMQYGAYGEGLVAALHKYEKTGYGLRDLTKHWKNATVEVDAKDRKKLELDLKFYKSKLKAANRYKNRGKGKGGPKGKVSEKEWSRGLLAVSENRPGAMEDQIENLTHFMPQTRKWEDERKRDYITNVAKAFMATKLAASKEDAVRIGKSVLDREIARLNAALREKRRPGRLSGEERKAAMAELRAYVKARVSLLKSFSDPGFFMPTIPGDPQAAPPPAGLVPLSGATPEERIRRMSMEGRDKPPERTPQQKQQYQSVARDVLSHQPAPEPAPEPPPEPPYGRPIRPAGAAKLQRVLSFIDGDKRKNQELAKALIGVAASGLPIKEGQRLPSTFLKPRGEKMTKDEASVANDLRTFINGLRRLEGVRPDHRISLWNRKGQPFFKSVSDVLGDLESWGPATSYQMLQSLIPPKEGR